MLSSYSIFLNLVQLVFFLVHKIKQAAQVDDIYTAQSATPYQINMEKGNYYLQNITPETPHYIDSAAECFSRAIRYQNTDTAAQNALRIAENCRRQYIDQVQHDISTDSAQYFLRMRRPTEGLTLFKYTYDQNDTTKGKFGYVDTNMRVVIPPYYDFNYCKMDQTGETFRNGRAKVCLKVADNDTVYFFIDRQGNPIEE